MRKSDLHSSAVQNDSDQQRFPSPARAVTSGIQLQTDEKTNQVTS